MKTTLFRIISFFVPSFVKKKIRVKLCSVIEKLASERIALIERHIELQQRQLFDILYEASIHHNQKYNFDVDCMLKSPTQIDGDSFTTTLSYLWNRSELLSKIGSNEESPKYVIIHGIGGDALNYMNYNYSLSQAILTAFQVNVPLIKKEDGFLRSADTWTNMHVPAKYVEGISFTFSPDVHYFESTKASYLERLINDKNIVISDEQRKRARKCIDRIVATHLTKYNHQPIYTPKIGRDGVKKILVVDQSYGDFSISRGMAGDDTFRTMLHAAMQENPEADIIIKTHPDALAVGTVRKGGYYSHIKTHDNIYTITETINPISLIKSVDKVYVCTTQLGFEALMCGKEVHTFGMPFYAGWGLTHDYLKCERRNSTRTLEEIFYIAYIMYSFYVNPQKKCRCEIEEAMDYLLSLRKEYFTEYGVRNDLTSI